MSHVFSIIILLLRLQVAKNANGVSLKTQELFLIVFCTRYLDLLIRYISLYNSVMKILYIGSTAGKSLREGRRERGRERKGREGKMEKRKLVERFTDRVSPSARPFFLIHET